MNRFQTETLPARSLGVKIPTYTSHENGHRDFFEHDARMYSRRFKVPTEWLLLEKGNLDGPVPTDEMPVKGEVRAGVWQEIDGLEDEAADVETVPILPNPFYQRSPQFALKVVGNSMNKIAMPGQYIIVASWPELGLEVRDGDLLVIRRQRAMTFEATVKRAKMGETGWEFWPESTDPKHQEPIRMDEEPGDAEVKVFAKVIGIYSRL